MKRYPLLDEVKPFEFEDLDGLKGEIRVGYDCGSMVYGACEQLWFFAEDGNKYLIAEKFEAHNSPQKAGGDE